MSKRSKTPEGKEYEFSMKRFLTHAKNLGSSNVLFHVSKEAGILIYAQNTENNSAYVERMGACGENVDADISVPFEAFNKALHNNYDAVLTIKDESLTIKSGKSRTVITPEVTGNREPLLQLWSAKVEGKQPASLLNILYDETVTISIKNNVTEEPPSVYMWWDEQAAAISTSDNFHGCFVQFNRIKDFDKASKALIKSTQFKLLAELVKNSDVKDLRVRHSEKSLMFYSKHFLLQMQLSVPDNSTVSLEDIYGLELESMPSWALVSMEEMADAVKRLSAVAANDSSINMYTDKNGQMVLEYKDHESSSGSKQEIHTFKGKPGIERHIVMYNLRDIVSPAVKKVKTYANANCVAFIYDQASQKTLNVYTVTLFANLVSR